MLLKFMLKRIIFSVLLLYFMISIIVLFSGYMNPRETICLDKIPEYCEYLCPKIINNQTVYKKIIDYEPSNYKYFINLSCDLNCSGTNYWTVNCTKEHEYEAGIIY